MRAVIPDTLAHLNAQSHRVFVHKDVLSSTSKYQLSVAESIGLRRAYKNQRRLDPCVSE